MAIQYKFLILVALIGLAYGLAPVKGACATGTIANQTCDTQVWRTMEARARIETEREIMQNQNLIFKPDSILTYVCFDSFASHAASTVGPLFTHTTYFEGKEIIPATGDNGMGKALNKVVIDAMKPYITGNFDHALLGGRGKELNLTKTDPTEISGSGSTYTCGKMSQVWAVAKCLNFLHTTNFATNDGFFPFLDLTAESGGESVSGYEGKKDVRKFPTDCSGEPITGSTWKDMYRLSRNEVNFGDPNKSYQYGTPLNKAFTEVRKLVEPAKSDTCEKPIKTGVKVILSIGGQTPYDDGVCTNPGCALSKDGTECKGQATGGSAAP